MKYDLARHAGRIIYLKDGIVTGEEIIKDPINAQKKLEDMPKLEDKINSIEENALL